MTKVKSKYLADFISENSDNPRRLWNSINNILHRIPPPALPEFTSVKSLCDHLYRYFVDNIETIRSKFPDKVQNTPQVPKTEIRFKINDFERASEDEIKKLISSSFLKSCDLHHSIESALLKVHSDIIISMDKGAVTALTLLDLSAAFDTIDHATYILDIQIDFLIGMEYLARLKFGFLLIYKIGNNP